MATYLRKHVHGGMYFFTVVTGRRNTKLAKDLSRSCLREAISAVSATHPFTLFASVLLPDHLHMMWRLPDGRDQDYSTRMRLIKSTFTRMYLRRGGREGSPAESRQRHGERSVWQRRFWEHTCRDDLDIKRCLDYLHWNPVKHGLAPRVIDWAWSSFHRFVRLGEYPTDWGGVNPCPGVEMPE